MSASRFMLEPLEERLFFSADIAGVLGTVRDADVTLPATSTAGHLPEDWRLEAAEVFPPSLVHLGGDPDGGATHARLSAVETIPGYYSGAGSTVPPPAVGDPVRVGVAVPAASDLMALSPALELRNEHDLHLTGVSPLSLDAPLRLDAGELLTGSGAIHGDVFNAGLVSPGNSPGIQSIVGDFTQSQAGELLIQIGGTTPGPGSPNVDSGYDQLQISGTANLDGRLTVSLLGGFQPQAGQIFDIMTYGTTSGHFAAASGLFGFGDGSLYFDVVQRDSNHLSLEVKEISSMGLAIETASQTAQDELGLYFNSDYFTDATLDHVETDGAIHVGNFFHLYGAFSWDVLAETVDVNTGLGTTLADQPVLSLRLALAHADLFVGPGGSYVDSRDTNLLADTNGDGNLTNDYIYNTHAAGLWIQNLNAGLVLMETLVPLMPDYVALTATADLVEFVGMSGLQFVGHNIAIGFNAGDSGIVGLGTPAVDFVSTYGAGGLALTAGTSTVRLDFSSRFAHVSVQDALLSVGDVLYLSGSFAFESGATHLVDVHTTNALGGTGELEDVSMTSMTMGVLNASGFVGYAPGGYFGSTTDSNPNNNWVTNPDAVGFAVSDLTAGFVFLEPTFSLTPDVVALGTFMAGKISVGSAGFFGMDTLEISASGVDAYANLASSWYPGGSAVVDFAHSFVGGGLSVPTGTPAHPVIIDFDDEILGISARNVTVKISDFMFLSGAFALEKGRAYDNVPSPPRR
ncbi:MAG: hypothetical protein H7837_13770 [Magnetococcus sp. MYC-9]